MSQSTTQPDFEIWDSAWASLQGADTQLFTRSTPRTIHAFRHRCYFEDLWPLIEQSGGRGKYLEVGAGRGTTSMYLASRGCDVTLLDYSPTGLAVARRNFARERLPAPRTVIADARNTGLDADAYDCVYSLGLLEHFDDPGPVLHEMLRVLKPGGYLYALVLPRFPARTRFLAYGLFAPWKLAWLLIPAPLRAWGKRLLGRQVAVAKPNRTEFSGPKYVGMLPEDAVTEVSWCFYCPYHEVYRGATADRWILTPAYRLHHALLKRLVKPSARTSAAFASCILLTCRKR